MEGTSWANITSIGRHLCRQILICEASYHKLFLASSNNGLNEDALVPCHVGYTQALAKLPLIIACRSTSTGYESSMTAADMVLHYIDSRMQRYRWLSVSNGYEEIVSRKFQACWVRSLPLISTETQLVQVANRNSTLLDLLSGQKRIWSPLVQPFRRRSNRISGGRIRYPSDSRQLGKGKIFS